MPGAGVTIGKGVSAVPAVFDPIKIAVLGASESARNANSENTWPARFSQIIQDGGPKDTLVYDLAYHGATYFQAMNSLFYGTNTMVQECIAWKPDLVYVSFGGNDVMNQGSADQRTLAQVKTDADALYAALRAGCPNALIIAIIPRAHDNTNFATPAVTLKNKAIASQFMELTAAGVAAGLWTNEMLEVGVSLNGTSAAVTGIGGKTRVGDLEALATYITVGPSTSFNVVGVNWLRMDYWKLQRLGCTLPDQAHHNVGAHQLMAAWVYKGSKALTAFTTRFPRLSSQIIADWQDPDSLFSYYLTSSGDGWVRAAGADVPGLNAGDINRFWGDQTLFSPEEWYLPWKTKVAIWPPTLATQNSAEFDGTFRIILQGGPPTQVMNLSIDGAAFFSTGESTDTHGNFETTVRAGVMGLTNASHAFRFKCGTESYGPYNITLSAPWQESIQTTDATATAFTLTAAKVVGSRNVTLKMTGISANGALTTPTGPAIIAAIPNAYVGQTYKLRIINNGGAFTWTFTANATGVTLVGTAHTIPQNTWREYEVKVATSSTVTFECIGTGTWS